MSVQLRSPAALLLVPETAYRHYGEDKYTLPLPGIEPRFFRGLTRCRQTDGYMTKLLICSCLQLLVANALQTRNLMQLCIRSHGR
jgi:hypothetical protein